MSVKQVIVMRKDLKMRRGKEIAQGSHASMKWLVDRLEFKDWNQGDAPEGHSWHEVVLRDTERDWVDGLFTKICLQVNSEEELMEIHDKAVAAGLVVCLITDSGATEFNGVPTKTCLAIGPDTSEKIDPITSHLKLY